MSGGPTKAKAGWRAGCSQDAGTWASGSEAEHSPMLRRWRTMARVGVALAGWALDRYALATDAPAPGTVEAADCIDAAAHYLAPIRKFSKPLKRARGGAA
jgi:hypothetical protein